MFRPELLVVLYQQTLQTDFTEFCEKWALAEEPIDGIQWWSVSGFLKQN